MKASLKFPISGLLVSFFFLVVLFLGLFAEVFDSEAPELDVAQIYANPIPVSDLKNLKKLTLVNKHGDFSFENTHPSGDLVGPWQMVRPQSLRVKGQIMAAIIHSLNKIRVRNFYHLEPINITSFSLDNPTMTLNLETTENKTFEIKMGLINPIDNSAYLSVSGLDQIYQIDPIEISLENYDLAQLVESKVLALNPDSLQALEIYQKDKLQLKVIKKEDQWFDHRGIKLTDIKVLKFFEQIEEIKSFFILSQLNKDQEALMDEALTKTAWTLKLISERGVRTYLIGEILSEIPGISEAKKGSYALSTDERNSFILIDRNELKILTSDIDLR